MLARVLGFEKSGEKRLWGALCRRALEVVGEQGYNIRITPNDFQAYDSCWRDYKGSKEIVCLKLKDGSWLLDNLFYVALEIGDPFFESLVSEFEEKYDHIL